jgi:tetratricopeptide (TPR) repeat protein
MKLFSLHLWPRSARSEVLSLYKEGLTRAEKQDSEGAMIAYTSAIDRAGAPNDIRAMALYNRALLFAAAGNTKLALADLREVIELPILQRDVKVAARRRIDRLQHRIAAVAQANPRTTT